MSLLSQSELAQNVDFKRRVQQAIATAAIDVSAEDPGTANHVNRVNLAEAVLSDPSALAGSFAIGVATNVTIAASFDQNGSQADIPDGDIQFVVNSFWDAYAGTL